MPWIATLFRRRRPNRRPYLVDLPDGTERSFDLESRTTIGSLLEVSLLSMSVPSQFHQMFCIISPTVVNPDDRRWLRYDKSLKRELKGLLLPLTLHVQVLLYPRDHYSVNHRVTKHLLYSQVKTDLGSGKLKCNSDIMAQLAGLVAQAELGNHSESSLQGDYMLQLKLTEMSPTEERQAIEQHKIRRDLNMEECIDEFLSISETLNGYGTHKFELEDEQDRLATLSCGPLGIEILMGNIQTIQFHWESITTINVHNRLINFQTESSYNQTGRLYSFRCISARMCKNIAVLCVNMRNYYCNSEVVRPTSKLRRLFSTRISRRQHSSRYNLRRNPSAVSSFSNPRFRSTRSYTSNRRPLQDPPFRDTPLQSPPLRDPLIKNQHGSTNSSIYNANTPTPRATPNTTPPRATSPHSITPIPLQPAAIPSIHLHTSSSTSFTLPLLSSPTGGGNTERGTSASPTSIESPTFPVLTILEENEPPTTSSTTTRQQPPPPTTTTPPGRSHSTSAVPHLKKATTLPAYMNPSDIANFGYVGAGSGGGNGNGSAHSHYKNHTHHNHHGGPSRKISEPGRRVNGYNNYHHSNGGGADPSGTGLSDNYDCITELLEEGLDKSSNAARRRERVSVGEVGDRRKVFPVENGSSTSNSNYRNRSYTLQNPKKGGSERRSSTSNRPFHYSTNSDPSKLLYSSSSSLYSANSSVATLANQLSLATLSQDSSYVDPHIKSLVFGSSSQADTTEL